MKTLSSALVLSVSLLAGLAAAGPSSVTTSETTVTAATPSGSYEYDVRHDGHNGRLIFGNDLVTYYRDNRPDDQMAWNYNTLKKIKTDRNRDRITLVFHGGETHTYKLKNGETVAENLPDMVANRIASAPRYTSWK